MKKNLLLLGILLLLLAPGCTRNEKGLEANTNSNANVSIANGNRTPEQPPEITKIKFCTELRSGTDAHKKMLERNVARAGDIDAPTLPKAAAARSNRWQVRGRDPLILTVKFLNGTDFQRNKVTQYVMGWTQASAAIGTAHKINFRFLPFSPTPGPDYSDVRILFGNGGSSSYVGTDNKNIGQALPTMHYGWVDEFHSEDEIKSVILHEFGHAIGLIHEHQAPGANIPWNKPAVYEYYRRTQDPPWTEADVDANVFYHYSVTSVNATAYDPTSIMHYAIPASLTIGGFSTPENSDLSNLDVTFIRRQYPYTPGAPDGRCYDTRGREVPCP